MTQGLDLSGLSAGEKANLLARLKHSWRLWARPQQLPPPDYAGEAELPPGVTFIPDKRAADIGARDYLYSHRPGDGESREVWRTWLLMAGRGFGKTRTGAEYIAEKSTQPQPVRSAVVAPTYRGVREVCFEGEDGLINLLQRRDALASYNKAATVIRCKNGSLISGYASTEPDRLRGPEFHYLWLDELCFFSYPDEVWLTGSFALRLRDPNCVAPLDEPRCLVTTTPRNIGLLRRILAGEEGPVVHTEGDTADNAENLPPARVRELQRRYEGTSAGASELHGKLVLDPPTALVSRGALELHRFSQVLPEGYEVAAAVAESGVAEAPGGARSGRAGVSTGGERRRAEARAAHEGAGRYSLLRREDFSRVVVAVDPSVSATRGSAETGILVGGLLRERTGRTRALVLEDCTVSAASPEKWGEVVRSAVIRWSAAGVVAERNQGGDMVKTVIRGAGVVVPVMSRWAPVGKAARAEPVAQLLNTGVVALAGFFPDLEDQLCLLVPGTAPGSFARGGDAARAGLTRSPDRADALVWLVRELLPVARGVPSAAGGGGGMTASPVRVGRRLASSASAVASQGALAGSGRGRAGRVFSPDRVGSARERAAAAFGAVAPGVYARLYDRR